MKTELQWKVHTPNLLKEILNNPQAGILRTPINILGKLLYQVGERAKEINDPTLNKLMMQLTIYSQADPGSKDYIPGLCEWMMEREVNT